MKTLKQQQYERALAGECDPEDFVELYRTFLGVEDQAAFWRQAAGAERREVERLRIRNGRLNKAVTWLAGALPDDVEFDWERGRAATLLGEDW